MSLSRILALRRERAALLTRAGRILTKASKAGRNLTAEEGAKFDRMHAKGDKLLGTITKMERARQAANTLSSLRTSAGGPAPGAVKPVHQVAAFRAWANNEGHLLNRNPHVRLAAKALGLRMGSMACKLRLSERAPRTLAEATERRDEVERRAMSVGVDTAGGYTVPEGFHSEVDVALLAFGGMRESATVMRTATGNDLPMPNTDDTSNEGEQLGENTGAATQDVVMGNDVLTSWKISSKMVLVSIELMQDEAVGLEALLGRLLGERIARFANRRATVGNGSNGATSYQGILEGAPLGFTAAAAAALVRDDLLGLKHSVNSEYRKNASWMWADTTLLAIKKLVDTTGQPLWTPGKVAEGEPDRFDGDPYIINDHMPAMATTEKAVAYGDLSRYHLRDVLGIDLHVFRERFMDQGSFGFLAFFRGDGRLRNAAAGGVKHLAMA